LLILLGIFNKLRFINFGFRSHIGHNTRIRPTRQMGWPVMVRSCKGGKVSATRDTQTKDDWRLTGTRDSNEYRRPSRVGSPFVSPD
jgi:hypothetical protein